MTIKDVLRPQSSQPDRMGKPRRFDTTPRKLGADGTTFLYDETGLPLRISGRTLTLSPNPVPCTMSLPDTLTIGAEVAFDAQVGPFWRVARIIHALSPTASARHIWLAPVTP